MRATALPYPPRLPPRTIHYTFTSVSKHICCIALELLQGLADLLQEAVDCFLRAGMWRSAVISLQKLGNYVEAAELYASHGENNKAAQILLKADDADALLRFVESQPYDKHLARAVADQFKAKQNWQAGAEVLEKVSHCLRRCLFAGARGRRRAPPPQTLRQGVRCPDQRRLHMVQACPS